MAFDPFKKRIVNTKPHVVMPATGPNAEAHCINCGSTGWDVIYGNSGCDVDSEQAKKFRRDKRDEMVGRITGNSTK